MAENKYFVPLRVAIGGNVDSSKSTFIGVLKTGQFDDGNGKVRASIFNYSHELKSGMTSSVSQKTITINDKKVIFFDLPGHEKFLRTTLFGMSSSYPHLALIMVEANKGVEKMTKEHIISAIYLRIPFAFVISKMDTAQPKLLKNTLFTIKKIMKNKKVNKIVWDIKDSSDIEFSVENFGSDFVPIFKISNVCGNNFDPPFHLLTDYISSVNNNQCDSKDDKKSLFIIDKPFRAKGFPLIGSGYMKSGKIFTGDKNMYLGPVNGELVPVVIRTIHDSDRVDVNYLRKEENGCIAFKVKNDLISNKKQLRSGMIITNDKNIKFTKQFIGKLRIFSDHHTTLSRKTTTVIHTGTIRKTVRIINIKKEGIEVECIRGGDENIEVTFEFLICSYYVEEGSLFIFRDGNTQGSGIITKIL